MNHAHPRECILERLALGRTAYVQYRHDPMNDLVTALLCDTDGDEGECFVIATASYLTLNLSHRMYEWKQHTTRMASDAIAAIQAAHKA